MFILQPQGARGSCWKIDFTFGKVFKTSPDEVAINTSLNTTVRTLRLVVHFKINCGLSKQKKAGRRACRDAAFQIMLYQAYASAFMLSKTLITLRTAVADSSNNAFSSSFKSNSIMRSIPFFPRTTGTPR